MVLHTNPTPTQGRSSYGGGGGQNGFGDGDTLRGGDLPHENLLLQRGPNRVAYPVLL